MMGIIVGMSILKNQFLKNCIIGDNRIFPDTQHAIADVQVLGAIQSTGFVARDKM
ncbi:MAG: hypothetical protein LBG09_02810 [Puniceicoccales bacterium]|jgi:hypothetical protein|nr:hypothetical protein [Puniceicoccales bacterium]